MQPNAYNQSSYIPFVKFLASLLKENCLRPGAVLFNAGCITLKKIGADLSCRFREKRKKLTL